MQEEKNITKKISKILSANDTGKTGGHQAGIFVPRNEKLLAFFPYLSPKEKNPRVNLTFVDDNNEKWEFVFIYYNNKFFGGTRNEYRLTWMTKFINSNNLKPGDEIIMINNDEGPRSITFKKMDTSYTETSIRLSNQWKIIDI